MGYEPDYIAQDEDILLDRPDFVDAILNPIRENRNENEILERAIEMENINLNVSVGVGASANVLPSVPDELISYHSTAISRHALGRIAEIGDIYDVHKDIFCGFSIFNENINNYITSKNEEKNIVKYLCGESIYKKLKECEFENDLNASVIAGMVKLNGHTEYLSSYSSKKTTALLYQMMTKYESVHTNEQSVFTETSIQDINANPSATHVVTGIHWGFGVTAALTEKYATDEEHDNEYSLLLNTLTHLIPSNSNETEENINDEINLQLHVYIDYLSDTAYPPETLEDTKKFITNLPEMLKKKNSKGVPMKYALTPLNKISRINFADRTYYKVEKSVNEKYLQIFDDVLTNTANLQKLYTTFLSYNYSLTDGVLQTVHNELQAYINLQKRLRDALLEVRHGSINSTQFSMVLNTCKQKSDDMSIYCDTWISFRDKVNYMQILEKKNILYVGKNISLEDLCLKQRIKEYFAYFCDWSNEENRPENSTLFLSLINKRPKLIFVDVQVNPLLQNVGVNGNRICHFLNGRCLNVDILLKNKSMENQRKNYVKCSEEQKTLKEEPPRHCNVILPCPKSFYNGYCESNKHEWYCYACNSHLQYDFHLNFYCKCGIAKKETFKYCCADAKHGDMYVKYDDHRLDELVENFESAKDINNILLLGTGKTAFINAFAYYLTSSTLTESEFFPLFQHITRKSANTIIMPEIPTNKILSFKELNTQQPLIYVFHIRNKQYRLIDASGCDNQETTTYEIFEHLSNYKKLHGICILLNEKEEDEQQLHYLTNFLNNLRGNKSNNIVFCCINTKTKDTVDVDNEMQLRIENYKKEFGIGTEESKDDKEKVYYINDEAVEFLFALQNGSKRVHIQESDKNNWEFSRKELFRLLDYLEKNVKPFIFNENNPTFNVVQSSKILIKILPDITKNIQQNILLISEKLQQLKECADNENLMEIPHIGIKITCLNFPKIICGAKNCVKNRKISESNFIEAVHGCYEFCYKEDKIPKEFVNFNSLEAVDNICSFCGCECKKHYIITFVQESSEFSSLQKKTIECLENRIQTYKNYQESINNALSKIAKFGDANKFRELIEKCFLKMIEREENRSNNVELFTAIREEFKKCQKEMVQLKEKVTQKEMENIRNELEALPLIGISIKALYDATRRHEKIIDIYSEKHFMFSNISKGTVK